VYKIWIEIEQKFFGGDAARFSQPRISGRRILEENEVGWDPKDAAVNVGLSTGIDSEADGWWNLPPA
jgi:hypothetical protein